MEIREQYRKDNLRCELCAYLRRYHKGRYNPRGERLELDHIFGRKGPCDVLSNYIMACPNCHDLKTVTMQKEARIASILVKLLKRELDEDELKACSGYHVLGWVEVNGPLLDEPWFSLSEKILRIYYDIIGAGPDTSEDGG
jgi:hypothetical protein